MIVTVLNMLTAKCTVRLTLLQPLQERECGRLFNKVEPDQICLNCSV
jgi:hypothetical protein